MNRRNVIIGLVLLVAAVAILAVVAALTSGRETPKPYTAAVSSSVDSDAQALLSQGWTAMQQAQVYRKWKTQNPGEATKLEGYWANGGAAPTLATVFGQSLTLDGRAYYTLSPTTPPPPSDTTPPTVALTAPANGATVNGTINVAATAADNVAVAKVEFYRDSVLFNSDTSSPYSASFDSTTVANGSHTFSPRAYDTAGNTTSGSGNIVTVSNLTPPPPSSANLFVSPNGSDAGSCTQAAPCRSLGRAYQVAGCGAVVEVAGGSYGQQTISETTVGQTCVGNPIVMRAAAGAQPVFQWIGFSLQDGDGTGPDNLTLDGFKVIWGLNLRADATNIVIDHFDGGSVTIGNANSANIPTNVIVRNSDWGPCNTGGGTSNGEPADCRTHDLGGSAEGKNKLYNSRNILIENNTFHDYRMTTGDHFECWWISADNTDITFRHNKFWNCETNAVALPCNTMHGTWIWENNWFGPSNPGNAGLRFCTKDGTPGDGTYIVRYNSFATGGSWGTEDTLTLGGRVHVIGNLFGENYECPNGALFFYNTYINDSPCPGETGGMTFNGNPYVQDSNPWPSGGNFDLHLSAGDKAAIDNRVPAGVDGGKGDLNVDWDGQTRPAGTNRDVGADER